MKLLAALLLVAIFGLSSSFYDGIETCSRPHVLVYKHGPDGVAQAGSKTALKEAVLRGAKIRLVVTSVNGAPPGDNIVSGANNINIRGSEVCAQVINHVGQNVYEHMPNTKYRYHIFCTTGAFHLINNEIDGALITDNVLATAGVSWFAWDLNPCASCKEPVYSHFSDSGTHSGHLANLVGAVDGGKDIHVLRRDVGYSTPLDYVQTTPAKDEVNGLSVWHVGQAYSPVGVTQNADRPYKWLSSWSTLGRRHNSRWEYSGQKLVVQNVDHTAVDWFVDPCWRLTYKHGAAGEKIQGSLADLLHSIEEGHRVRVKLGNAVQEPKAIRILDNGAVHVQLSDQVIQKGGIGEDKFDITDQATWIWTFADTTGKVVRNVYLHGTNTEATPPAATQEEISWYTDSRPWSRMLTVAPGGAVTDGGKLPFQKAIDAGANIRMKVEIAGAPRIYLPADNAIHYLTTNEESIAQSMRTLGVDPAGNLIKPPQWHFYLANTKGEAEIAIYGYGLPNSFISKAPSPATMTFYADDHVPLIP